MKYRTATLKTYGRQIGMLPEATPDLEKIEDATEFIVALKATPKPPATAEEAWQRYRSNVGMATQRHPESDFVSAEYFTRLWNQFNPAPVSP